MQIVGITFQICCVCFLYSTVLVALFRGWSALQSLAFLTSTYGVYFHCNISKTLKCDPKSHQQHPKISKAFIDKSYHHFPLCKALVVGACGISQYAETQNQVSNVLESQKSTSNLSSNNLLNRSIIYIFEIL